ncbi:MAG: hypothetical protein HC836_45680 [Richelia sp. RM2_1_2]|nr:hypothetical protein [Richelia sp. RM2_1_2]
MKATCQDLILSITYGGIAGVFRYIGIEVPKLGDRIRQAREADSRSLAEICLKYG